MGFFARWVNLIMECVQSTFFLMLLNDIRPLVLYPSRGLRQGTLFLLFSSSFAQKVSPPSWISGLRVNRYCLVISHLFFANDSLMFFKAHCSGCYCNRSYFGYVYENAFDHTINFEKSIMVASQNAVGSEVELIKWLLKVRVQPNLGRYLRLPSHYCRNKQIFFRNIKVRVWNTL